MKRLKIFALLGCIICLFFAFAACKSDELATPTGLTVDIDNKMTWAEVDDARTYKISIKNVDTGETTDAKSKRASYSLSKLEEGDYEIKIMALAGNDESSNSDWSKVLYFHKNYETGCVYELINNYEYTIKSVGSASGTITLEDEYRGKPVTAIGDNAFKGSSRIENVVIGKNVKSIGKNAFYNCTNLVSITIPASVNVIGNAAFQSCRSLKTIVIPEGITEIGEYTFAYCRGLESVTLPSTVKTIGESAFSDCSALKEISIPDAVTSLADYVFSANTSLASVRFGKSLKTIGQYAFYKCGALKAITFASGCELNSIAQYAFSECVELTEITLPNKTETIEYATFYKSAKLAKVELPDSLMRIGAYAFSETALYVADDGFYYVDDWVIGVTEEVRDTMAFMKYTEIFDGTNENKSNKIANLREGIVGLGDNVFAGALKLNRVFLTADVRSIGDGAFINCTELTQVTTEDNSVKRIGSEAFSECSTLSSLTLCNGLERIGDYAFYRCTLLANNLISGAPLLPDTVKSIGRNAFKESGLWINSTDPYGLVYAGNWVVGYRNTNNASPVLSTNTVGIADYAFYQHPTLMSVMNLGSVSYIGKGAFMQCPSLSAAVIGSKVKTIEEYTFYKCSSLLTIESPQSIESIGKSAFYKCESLEALDLSWCNVAEIGEYAFYGCMRMKTVDLGTSLKKIDNYAFYKAESLEALTLPDKLESIGEKAFAKSTALKTLDLGKGLETVGVFAFQNCTALETLTIPTNVKTISDYAFYKCTGLTEVIFEEFVDAETETENETFVGVEKIGDYAFYNVSLPTSLHLPRSVKSVGKYAFKGWTGVISLTLNKTIEDIGAHAFYGSRELTVYTNADPDNVGWDSRWNSLHRPVIWGCELSEDGKYVLSFTLEQDSISNVNARGGITPPSREGKVFGGWLATVDEETVVYTCAQFKEIPIGTVLTAIWNDPLPEEPEDDGKEEEGEQEGTEETPDGEGASGEDSAQE